MSYVRSLEGHRLRDLRFTVATRMLDHMSISMYSKYPKAIGELVVNGYDADANNVTVYIKVGAGLVPQEKLDSLVRNPQALVNIEAQGQLGIMFEQLGPQATLILEQVMQSLRNALDVALSDVFFIGLITLLIAFVINFFIKEVPLRKQHAVDEAPTS